MSLLIKAVPGVTNFLGLTDTPASYSGQASRVAMVNTGEDALEFHDPPERATPTFACCEPQLFRPSVGSTWEDFNLEKCVPEGALGAIFHLTNNDPGVVRDFGLRKKGSTDDWHGSLQKNGQTWAIVGLDENRKCQGYCESLATADFLLVGYTGENFTFSTNGDDIRPTVKTAWVDTDLSPYIPAGAVGVIIEFSGDPDPDYTDEVGVRKHGSTDDRHRSVNHAWAVIGVDSNRHVDLYDGDWPNPMVFNLIGYITAGVTFYDNGQDLNPTADGAYHTVTLPGTDRIIAFIELDNPYRVEDWAIRKNWACGDIYKDAGNHNFCIIHPNTPTSNIDVKLSHVDIDLFLLGIG